MAKRPKNKRLAARAAKTKRKKAGLGPAGRPRVRLKLPRETPWRPPARAIIYFVRHGPSEGNRFHRFDGSRIDAPLTREGRALAGYVAMHFPFRPDAVLSSPLSRAMQTARPLAARFGLPVIPLSLAMEQDYGRLSGKTRDELMQPRYRRHFHFAPSGQMYTLSAPGGESWENLKKRARKCLAWLDRHYAGKRVAVVSHSDFINCAYGVRRGLADERVWERQDVANGAAVRL